MSMPAKSNFASSRTPTCLCAKPTVLPADRSLASGTNSPIGNSRSSRMDNRASPTTPVAPTIATL